MCPLTTEHGKDKEKKRPLVVRFLSKIYFIKLYASWMFCLHAGALRGRKRMPGSPEVELTDS